MVVQPKYKIVHSYPVDLGDSWGGYSTQQMEYEKSIRQKIPTHLTVTIDLKWADSMKDAKLDINESTLLFELPDVYYLDLNLKYKCDPNEGNAKFDKTKKTLTIKLPIVGLTPDSQAVLDANYQKFVIEQQKRLETLQVQGEKQQPEDEAASEALKKLESMSSSLGVAQKVMNMSGDSLQDTYNLESDTTDIKRKIMENQEDSDDDRDTKTSSFLNVYDETKNSRTESPSETNSTLSEIKLKPEEVQTSI